MRIYVVPRRFAQRTWIYDVACMLAATRLPWRCSFKSAAEDVKFQSDIKRKMLPPVLSGAQMGPRFGDYVGTLLDPPKPKSVSI